MTKYHVRALTSLAIGIFIFPLSSFAQIIINPGSCPPGYVFVPPISCELAPSPSPTPPTRDPIILIPGITVSHNKKLLYKDIEGGKWKFARFFNVYKGLVKKLESAGYEEGKDLLIAHYDWRNPAMHNATTYLKPIIDQVKQQTGASKVNIVAHSFGGIIARAYIQSDDYANDIDQLITLGSPHQGSADAYVAWEGGIYPEGWTTPIRYRIDQIEKALKKSRHQQKDIQRPDSFRTFFPSLRDMLPLQDFVNREGSLLAVADLVEQNSFLKNLHDTFSSIATKGVDLTTIAGTSVNTLGQVNITNDRDADDEKLNRWRDGHAETIPPPLNSTEGDARVLLSSAHVGDTNINIAGAVHHKLPDEAQDKVFEILGLEPQPSFFSTFPKKIVGILVLSPVEVVIEGPNGEILSQDQNDFGEDNAEYDDDPDDPDDPIELNIADPPDGIYTATYTGTGSGEYTIITSYADEDEVTSSTDDGTTYENEQWTKQFYIGNETYIPDASLLELTKQLKQTIKDLHKEDKHKNHENEDKHKHKHEHKDKHIKHHGKLLGATNKLHNHAKKYIKSLDKHGDDAKKTQKDYDKLLKSFAKFSDKLDKEITKEHLDETSAQQLIPLRDAIQAALQQ